MTIIDTANEREFANNTGYLEGGGSEIRLHLHSLIDEVEKLRAADPLTQAIQRLKANTYSLTKSECIHELERLRYEMTLG